MNDGIGFGIGVNVNFGALVTHLLTITSVH